MKLLAVSIEIRGKVQGVWYRISAQKEAQRLNLTGFVKNQEDGSVYLEACGESTEIKYFINWCLNGPEDAEVMEIHIKKIKTFSSEKFKIIK